MLNISVVCDKSSWINNFKDDFSDSIDKLNMNLEWVNDHNDLQNHEVVCFLSYSKIVKHDVLQKNIHNLVVHESDLPSGKGWSPLTWQILEGKNTVCITLFEAAESVDSGKIYLKKHMKFNGSELVNDLRAIQAGFTFRLILQFIKDYDSVVQNAQAQAGVESFYSRRTPEDSQLDINKSIDKQFNLLRVVDNDAYPAFFYKNGIKYFLKIYRSE